MGACASSSKMAKLLGSSALRPPTPARFSGPILLTEQAPSISRLVDPTQGLSCTTYGWWR